MGRVAREDLKRLMEQAFREAEAAFAAGEVPIGAAIGCGGTLVAAAHNEVERRGDPTAHAEMLVLQAAVAARGVKFLEDCVLYVTLEPCAMCAAAMSWARLGSLFFGAYDPKSGGVMQNAAVFSHAASHHKPEVYGGLCEVRAATLLKKFFENRRAV